MKIFLRLGLKHLSECCVIVDLSQGSGLSTCFSYLYMYGYGMSLCMYHIGCFMYIMQMRNSLLITIDMLISQYGQHKSMTHNDPKLLIILNWHGASQLLIGILAIHRITKRKETVVWAFPCTFFFVLVSAPIPYQTVKNWC